MAKKRHTYARATRKKRAARRASAEARSEKPAEKTAAPKRTRPRKAAQE